MIKTSFFLWNNVDGLCTKRLGKQIKTESIKKKLNFFKNLGYEMVENTAEVTDPV